MRSLGLACDRILTSPYLRARETAEIVARELGATHLLEEEPSLASGARIERVLKVLSRCEGAGSILLVGHQPDLSEMTAALIGGDQSAIAYGTGSLACVDVSAIPPVDSGTLRWLLTLNQLVALGP